MRRALLLTPPCGSTYDRLAQLNELEHHLSVTDRRADAETLDQKRAGPKKRREMRLAGELLMECKIGEGEYYRVRVRSARFYRSISGLVRALRHSARFSNGKSEKKRPTEPRKHVRSHPSARAVSSRLFQAVIKAARTGDMAKEEEKKESGEWKEFFWNPRTHELLGRTASSWGLILLFYLIFYTFLAGMFCLTMYVMLLTLDDYQPTWQDRLATPGMMIRPKADPLEIVYNVDKTESWDSYIQALDNFLTPYNDSTQVVKNDACVPDRYFVQEDSGEVRNNPKRSCQFNRTVLGSCSGLIDRTYGYQEGKPCVLIKLNRVIGLRPSSDDKSPFVTCTARGYADGDERAQKMAQTNETAEVEYFPPNGTFNLMYYPYYGKKAQVNYSQPLVAVKFIDISFNTDFNVECKINSSTQFKISERDKFAGRVSFKLRINKV
ncbi:hypothetical protein QQF64_020185 [Cirrhinus molitorella]|uniref:Sodium/potassium-transporting ATPase subunit beta-2 n=1 Tax=Cirrhinus molitorella TaxID=172907 RepID=A0ABR3L9X2_9TELE